MRLTNKKENTKFSPAVNGSQTLTLITTESFGDLSCNFYKDNLDDILLTREQIGQALEYANPIKAIQKIHLAHQDRLEKFCLRIKPGHPQTGTCLLHRKRNYGNLSLVPAKESRLIHGLDMGYRIQIPQR